MAIFFISTFLLLAVGRPSHANFDSRFKNELQYESRQVSMDSQKIVGLHHVVFITGIMSEVSPGYFRDNVDSLKFELGSKNYSVIRPPTEKSVEENGKTLSVQLRTIFEKNNRKPLILIAHSKGGLEVLEVLFKDTEFFNASVAWAVFVQSPFQGTPVADFFFRKCPASASTGIYCNAGYRSLLTQVSVIRLNQQVSSGSSLALNLLATRTRTIRAAEDIKDVSLMLKFTARILAKQNELNDGVILLRDQAIPGFNLDLGIVKSDHNSLVSDGFVSNKKSKIRRAFTRALFEEILNLPE